jgi:DNA-binding response OmpR family regulator
MKKILIAEDNQMIGAALEIRLKAAGYDVQVLTDGFCSYIRAMSDPPDLLLMDIFMPDGSGLEVAKKLKSTALADIPIIFMTASKDKNLKATAESVGAAAFLEKPFDTERLLAAITHALGRKPKRILIAEDDRKIGAALEIRLKAAGYEVQVVPDGFRSYVRAMSDPPDLLLMDIFMPFGSGLEVAQELRSSGFADVPIIFMTASKEPNLREKAKNIGAAGFFEKPFDTETLLGTIIHAIERKSTMQSSA